MQRISSETKQHKDLINMMVNHFNSQGYRNIKADIAGIPRPEVIYGTIAVQDNF